MTPKRQKRLGRSGQTLVSVLVSASIMTIVMMGFLAMSKFQSKATRNIAGLGGVNDLGNALDLLFYSRTCEAPVGGPFYLYNGRQAKVTVTSPTVYSVLLDTLKFSNDAIAITTSANTQMFEMLQPYSIASNAANPPGILMAASGTYANLGGATGYVFPFQMKVNFAAPPARNPGPTPLPPPPLPISKYVNVFTDDAFNVTGMCYSSVASGSMTLLGIQSIAIKSSSVPGAGSVGLAVNGVAVTWGGPPTVDNHFYGPLGVCTESPTAPTCPYVDGSPTAVTALGNRMIYTASTSMEDALFVGPAGSTQNAYGFSGQSSSAWGSAVFVLVADTVTHTVVSSTFIGFTANGMNFSGFHGGTYTSQPEEMAATPNRVYNFILRGEVSYNTQFNSAFYGTNYVDATASVYHYIQ